MIDWITILVVIHCPYFILQTQYQIINKKSLWDKNNISFGSDILYMYINDFYISDFIYRNAVTGIFKAASIL